MKRSLTNLVNCRRDLQQVPEGESSASIGAMRIQIDALVKQVETSATTDSELGRKVHGAMALQLSLLLAALGTAIAVGWGLSRTLIGPS